MHKGSVFFAPDVQFWRKNGTVCKPLASNTFRKPPVYES